MDEASAALLHYVIRSFNAPCPLMVALTGRPGELDELDEQDGQDEQTLTKNADIAMYQAKAEGKNNFQFYSDKLNANSLERLTLESSLRHALERDEFRLHYQAKRDIRSGRIAWTRSPG